MTARVPVPTALTPEERLALVQQAYGHGKRRSKYGNERCDCGLHDSRKECEYGRTLATLERLGQVRNVRRQVAYELAPAVRLAGEDRAKPAIRYVADYVFEERREALVPYWVTRVVDVKSAITRRNPVYRLKKHLMKAVHGVDVTEV